MGMAKWTSCSLDRTHGCRTWRVDVDEGVFGSAAVGSVEGGTSETRRAWVGSASVYELARVSFCDFIRLRLTPCTMAVICSRIIYIPHMAEGGTMHMNSTTCTHGSYGGEKAVRKSEIDT